MAKLNEEIIVIKVSTLVPDHADTVVLLSDDSIAMLQQVIEQMAGDNKVLIEIERA